MKACTTCGAVKELSEFRKLSSSKDGHAHCCRDCRRLQEKRYREADAEGDSERKRAWRQKNIELLTERRKAWYAENKQDVAGKALQYRESNDKAVKAHRLFAHAMKMGRIKRHPCFVCGEEKVEGHHPNYDAPLDVVWLCRMHHRQAHALARRCK